jgi:hypothetical protein
VKVSRKPAEGADGAPPYVDFILAVR